MSILDMIKNASPENEYSLDSSSESSDTESPPNEPEHLLRSVTEPDVSLDEMLSLACRQGKLDIVQLLLQSGAHVNHRNKAGNTPLLEACSQGHVDVANYLLENGSQIDAPTETTLDSALTWACTLGNQTIVDVLLVKKADVEHRTKDGCTALMFACLAGHKEVAEKLLDAKSEINVESDSNKDSPLTFACWKGHANVVELLLKRNANIEHRTKEGFSPLMFAALGGHTDVARKLLERHAQVNVPSGSNNDIPLTSACWKGHHDVVKLLLEYSSNIEHRTKDGCTPLMLAAREGHINVARLLLENKAEVNVPSGSENNIPLTLACWKGHCDVVQLLLDNRSDIEHRNKAGCTPLMLAAREGHFDTTKLLLERGAQVNIPSGSNDDTPLTLACWKGHQDVVVLLLEYKSNLDHQTKTGCTPLMEATREGHKEVAEILLNHNADVELPDNYGQSPLFMACWKGHHAVGELLLQRGAHRDCRTKTGITPLFQACRENHVSIVELLLDFGAGVNNPFPNSRENPMTLSAEKGHKALIELLIARGATHDCRTKKGCTPVFLACKEGHFDIASRLCNEGANMEMPDCRGTTPIMAAFKNGHFAIVEWLVNRVHHLPSDELCHKILMSSVDEKEKEVVLQKRSKCLTIIQEVKKKREQLALRNAQILVKELDDERNREEKKKKKQAAKRRDKRNKRKRNKEAEAADKGVVDGHAVMLLEGNGVSCNEPNEEDEDNDDDELKDSVVPTENRDGGSSEDMNGEGDAALASKFGQLVLEEKEPIHMTPKKRSRRKTKSDNLSGVVPCEEKLEKTLKVLPTIDLSATKSELLAKLGSRGGAFVGPDKNGLRPGLSVNQKIDLHLSSQGCAVSSSDLQSCAKSIELQGTRTVEHDVLCKPTALKQVGKVEDMVDGLAKQFSGAAFSPVHSSKQSKDFSPIRVPPKTSGISTQSSSTQGPSRVPTSSAQNSSKKSKKPHSLDSAQLPPRIPVVTSVAVTTAATYVTTMSDPRTEVAYITPSFLSVEDWESGFSEQEDGTVEVARGEANRKQAPSSVNHVHNEGTNDEFRELDWQEVLRNSRTAVFEMVVPNAYCGRVIGKAGRKINQITEETGAQITVEKPATTFVPTKRLIRIRGTPSAADRARCLVTKALNTPSFNKDSNDAANSVVLKQASCDSDAAVPACPSESARQSSSPVAAGVPAENGAPLSVGYKSSSADVSAQPLITPSIPHGLLPYSKVATGQITLEDVHKHLVKQSQQQVVQPRPVPPFGTPMNTISMLVPCQQVSGDRPLDSVAELPCEKTNFGIIGDSRSKSSSKDTSPTNQTRSIVSISESPKASSFASKGFSYFSPWPAQSPDQKIFQPSKNSPENHLPLQGSSEFVEASKVGKALPTYQWQQNTVAVDRSRSVSWTDRSKDGRLTLSDADSISDPGSRSLSINAAATAERQNVVISPWNTLYASPRKPDEPGDEQVFVEDLTWNSKVATVPADVLVSSGDGWELSSSPTSSVSSSKVELTNILDSECPEDPAHQWTARSSEQGGSELPQDSPFQHAGSESSPWIQSRGAYSAPSSPALNGPVPQNQQSHIRTHPSMEELHVNRPWSKARSLPKAEEQSSWSLRRVAPSSFNHGQLSGGELKTGSSLLGQDSGMASPRMRAAEPEGVPSSSSGSQWTVDRFQDVRSVADLLLQLSLDKYTPKFEEQCISLEILVNFSEGNLQAFGIPKGPRLKILKACDLLKGRRVAGLAHMQSTLSVSAQTFVSSMPSFQSHLHAQQHQQQPPLPVVHQTSVQSLSAQHMLTQATSHQVMSAFQPFQQFPMPQQSFGMVVPTDGLPQNTYLAQTLPHMYAPSGSEFMNHLPMGQPSVGGLHPSSTLHSVTTLPPGEQPQMQMLFQEPTGFYFYPSS